MFDPSLAVSSGLGQLVQLGLVAAT
jgi:hypothetical protein